MKNFTLSLFLLLLVVGGTLVSCKTGAPQQSTTTDKTVTITETVHDTVLKIEKDNSYYEALLECQNNKVVVKDIKSVSPGKNLKAPKVSIDNDKLSVDCEQRAHELFLQWKARNISTEVIKTVDRPYPVERELTFWQELQIWGGRIFLLIMCGFVIYAAYKLLT